MKHKVEGNTILQLDNEYGGHIKVKLDHACEDDQPINILIGDDSDYASTWINDQELADTIKMLTHARKLLKERAL